MARKQASITMGSIAGAIAIGGGEAEIAEIMRFERAYEHNPYFEERKDSEAFAQRRREKSHKFFEDQSQKKKAENRHWRERSRSID